RSTSHSMPARGVAPSSPAHRLAAESVPALSPPPMPVIPRPCVVCRHTRTTSVPAQSRLNARAERKSRRLHQEPNGRCSDLHPGCAKSAPKMHPLKKDKKLLTDSKTRNHRSELRSEEQPGLVLLEGDTGP